MFEWWSNGCDSNDKNDDFKWLSRTKISFASFKFVLYFHDILLTLLHSLNGFARVFFLPIKKVHSLRWLFSRSMCILVSFYISLLMKTKFNELQQQNETNTRWIEMEVVVSWLVACARSFRMKRGKERVLCAKSVLGHSLPKFMDVVNV